jgi:uncharacterized protein
MSEDFRGRGWRFPILPDGTGALSYCQGQDNIEQSLKVLLLTALGERVMRPAFGTDAPRMVFAPGSEQNLRLLEQSIRAAIRDFEPRIDVLDVRAESGVVDPGLARAAGSAGRAEARVTVSIAYVVRRSNSRFNLVFPFYLGTVEVV